MTENKMPDAIPERIQSRVVVRENGCHEWTGACNRYARVYFNKKIEQASRVFWMLNVGPIPDGMYLCHKCDNTKCVNVDHLFLGTPLQNNLDAVSKRRVKSKITEDQAKEIKLSSESVASLMSKYGITRSSIYRIKDGTAWRHI